MQWHKQYNEASGKTIWIADNGAYTVNQNNRYPDKFLVENCDYKLQRIMGSLDEALKYANYLDNQHNVEMFIEQLQNHLLNQIDKFSATWTMEHIVALAMISLHNLSRLQVEGSKEKRGVNKVGQAAHDINSAYHIPLNCLLNMDNWQLP